MAEAAVQSSSDVIEIIDVVDEDVKFMSSTPIISSCRGLTKSTAISADQYSKLNFLVIADDDDDLQVLEKSPPPLETPFAGIRLTPSSSKNAPKAHDLTSIVRKTPDSSGIDEGRGEQWVEAISWEPRAFVYHNFLSKEECDYLVNLAKPHMKRSTVIDSSTGKSIDSRSRTSTGTFLARGRDEIIRNIEKRIADFTFIPVENGEGLQVIHYEVGQKYEPHLDYSLDEHNTKNGGQRMATLLMYLSDVEEGGETVFPNAKKGNISALPWWNELSECGKKGLSIKPKMGDALLFWNMKPDGTLDPSTLHGGCPVIKGNKWASTKWMHVHEYKKPKESLM